MFRCVKIEKPEWIGVLDATAYIQNKDVGVVIKLFNNGCHVGNMFITFLDGHEVEYFELTQEMEVAIGYNNANIVKNALNDLYGEVLKIFSH